MQLHFDFFRALISSFSKVNQVLWKFQVSDDSEVPVSATFSPARMSSPLRLFARPRAGLLISICILCLSFRLCTAQCTEVMMVTVLAL
jgi:hypothetical protein